MDFLNYDSSSVDWCEPNYVWSPYVAEWWNTISSFILLFQGFVLSYYGKDDQALVFGRWFIVIGIGSIIFHGMLSTFGQFVDECAISCLLWYTLAMIFNWNTKFVWLLTLMSSGIFFVYPPVNAFVLVGQGIVMTILIFNRVKKKSRLLRIGGILFVIAIVLWILDRICFQTVVSLHAFWHIFISMSTFSVIMWYLPNKHALDAMEKHIV